MDEELQNMLLVIGAGLLVGYGLHKMLRQPRFITPEGDYFFDEPEFAYDELDPYGFGDEVGDEEYPEEAPTRMRLLREKYGPIASDYARRGGSAAWGLTKRGASAGWGFAKQQAPVVWGALKKEAPVAWGYTKQAGGDLMNAYRTARSYDWQAPFKYQSTAPVAAGRPPAPTVIMQAPAKTVIMEGPPPAMTVFGAPAGYTPNRRRRRRRRSRR